MIISILKSKNQKKPCLNVEIVSILIQNHHTVLIQGNPKNKKLKPYLNVGAYIINTKEELLDRSNLIIKKNPLKDQEIDYLNGEEKIIFSCLEFNDKNLIKKILEHKITFINYLDLAEIKKNKINPDKIREFSSYVLPFLLELANKQIASLVDDEALRQALILMNNKIYNHQLAEKYSWPCYEF